MGEPWRFVDAGAVTPFENVAMMPVLSRQVAETGRPVVMTSVWGQTHLNVGWFDDVDATLDLAAAAERGVAVIRRPMYGGGTAFYDAGCAAMWGYLLPKGTEWDDLDAALGRFVPAFEDTLARLGLAEVQFEGSSDLRWHGRKLGAMTAQDVIACTTVGGFLNTAPPNLDLYLAVARVPDEKFADKVVTDLREYVCTAEEVRGRPLPYAEFRDALVAGLRAAGFDLDDEPLGEGERVGVTKIAAKVGSDDAVRRISSERFTAAAPEGSRVGFANHKGRKLCRAGVALDEASGEVVAALLAGDMHVSPPDTLDRAAAALVGAAADDRADLRARLASVFDGDDVHQAEAAMGVTTDDLLVAVEKAVAAGVGLKLDGATALVTGASSGIGRETARSLAARGARVVVSARRTHRLDALVAELPGEGHVALAVDLSAPGAAEALAADAQTALGQLDVLVHNAGIPKRRHVTALTIDEVGETMFLNYEVPVRMTFATLPGMLERGRGCHVYVSSLGGRLGIGTEAAYCASKFALAGWAEAMAVDLWDTPVDVRLCLPGAIETEIWDQPGNDAPLYDGPLEPATTVAEDIADQIEGDTFEVFSPDMRAIIEWKTSDPGAFLAGVAEMARRKHET